ncbi:hypothetical protein DS988_27400 [Escherichia coli]|nr:hypothetical protein DS988_27400 [Escherichia coli]
MIKIRSDMILCVLLNYHITCPFPVVQIRFPAVQDLPLPPHNATSCQHNSDAPRRGGKQRYDYFLSVVHFRKVVIFRKVGSDGNGSPVI